MSPQRPFLCVGLMLAFCAASEADPAWWTTPATAIKLPAEPAHDYSPANLGQLKHVATQANQYLDTVLAVVGGSGSAVDTICQFTNAGNFAPANLGQLKNVAKPFYDRLAEIHYNWQTGTYGTPSTPYPWTTAGSSPENAAPANLGQLKNVFAFELSNDFLIADEDEDGLKDWHEYALELDPDDPDTDGDGFTDLEEIAIGTDPTDPWDKPSSSPPSGPPVQGGPGDIPAGVLTSKCVGDNPMDEPKSASPPSLTIPANSSSTLVVLAINTEEFREYTQKASGFNDTVEWTISGTGFSTMTGSTNVNSLHADFFSSWFLSTTFLGYGSVHTRVLGVVPSNSASNAISIDLKVTNINDSSYPTTALIALLPIEFITPAGDPVNSPVDAGTTPSSIPDGANEFTFSTATTGVLTMKLKAKVTGVGSFSAAEQAKFKFEVDAIGNSTFAWDAANPGGKATVSGDFLTATATYTGLPQNNTDFGLKKARVKYDGNNAGEAKFEVFFPKGATNHPGTGSGATPNWYHYWAGTAVAGYDLTSGTYSYASGGAGDYALYNGNPANPQYTIHGPASAGHEQYNSAGLNVDRKGIDTLACTLVHEKTHRQVDQNWLPGGIWHGKPDSDSDELPDDWEDANAALGYDKNNRWSFTGFPYGDDEEVYCERAAFGTTGDSTKDWANPGKQSKTKF